MNKRVKVKIDPVWSRGLKSALLDAFLEASRKDDAANAQRYVCRNLEILDAHGHFPVADLHRLKSEKDQIEDEVASFIDSALKQETDPIMVEYINHIAERYRAADTPLVREEMRQGLMSPAALSQARTSLARIRREQAQPWEPRKRNRPKPGVA